MRITPRDLEDFELLSAAAHDARAAGVDLFIHLDQPVGRWNYVRIANEIAERVPRGRLLDWGCGFGQMTHLLRRRGFEVTPYDVGPGDPSLARVPLTRDLDIIRGTHPTELPFADGAFDCVLSCGVFEHVDEFSEPGNEEKSLRELRRVLKPGGRLVIYQLPQRLAWQEAIMRRWKRGYWHPRRFSAREIERMLAAAGFHVDRLARNNLLPKNLTGAPGVVRRLYAAFGRGIIDLDRMLCAVPGINRLAGVLELVARRSGD